MHRTGKACRHDATIERRVLPITTAQDGQDRRSVLHVCTVVSMCSHGPYSADDWCL